MNNLNSNTVTKQNATNRNDVLKLIAIITMLIDHIGFFFFPDELLFRQIGRLSFPIFCYLITVGYVHTSNFNRYVLRLLKFALISQAPYAFFSILSRGSMGYNPLNFNVLFNLILGLYTLKIYDCYKAQKGLKKPLTGLGLALFIALPRLASIIFMGVKLPFIEGAYDFSLSYGSYGLLLILIFYVYKDRLIDTLLAFALLSYFHGYLDDMVAISRIGYVAEPLVRFQRLFDITVVEPFRVVFTAGCPRPLALLILNRLLSMVSFSRPYIQFYAVFGIFTIYALKDLSFKFRMPQSFAYWFYPLHLAVLGIIDFLIQNGLI